MTTNEAETQLIMVLVLAAKRMAFPMGALAPDRWLDLDTTVRTLAFVQPMEG